MPGRAIAVDVGGTFIDLVSVDPANGEVAIEKQPSTPDRLVDELLTAVARLPGSTADVDRFLHGSTVAINTLLQRRGATVGLITTRGFRDVLELARGNRPHIYDWLYVPPEPLVPRDRRREVTERLGPKGEEIAPLDLDELMREVDALVTVGVEAVAICFLHAYANPKHERQAADAIASRHPSLPVTLSSEVAAEWHEYERTSTAVVNAYVQPALGGYLASMQGALGEVGVGAPIGIMQSSGGVMSVPRAIDLPVRTLASGPAGGVIGAASLARTLGHPNAICADVGGTTYDVAIIEDGRVQERTETLVGGLPVLAPTIDVVSIGAGGGSIAWIDESGALRVGPVSAGAHPGPACFGFGGVEPTVTDCHVMLGRLDPERFLGGRMQIDVAAAERAISEHVAEPLGLSLEEAADGVLLLAETAMANAIRSTTVERGADPRSFALYSYGGGGGLFAAATASELGIETIVVPWAPANFSAWGILSADLREDVSTTRVRDLDLEGMRGMIAELDALRADVIRRLTAYGFVDELVRIEPRADLRFRGQEHTITIDVDPAWRPEDVAAFADRFVERHRRLYGHGDPMARVEIVTVRCRGSVSTPGLRWPEVAGLRPAEPRGRRDVWFREAGGQVSTAIYERDELIADQVVAGPALVVEWTSTVVVPPGWRVRMLTSGELILTRERPP